MVVLIARRLVHGTGHVLLVQGEFGSADEFAESPVHEGFDDALRCRFEWHYGSQITVVGEVAKLELWMKGSSN